VASRTLAAGVAARPPRARQTVRLAQRIVARPLSGLGVGLVATLVLIAIIGPFLVRYDPLQPDMLNPPLAPPGSAHLMGTDYLGRDALARLVYGAGVSLQVGIAAVALASAPGIFIGIVAAYRGGWLDDVINRLFDSLMAFPSLVLALTIVAVVGPTLLNVVIAIAIASLPQYARLVRGQVLAVREFEYITAVRAAGAEDARIMFRHVLPNVISPALVQASLGVGFAITAEASLSFLGVGVQPPAPTWGDMIQTGFQYLQVAPWLVIAPGTMIFIAVLGFNLLGDGIRDALDPHMRTVR
jgi:ABC-type dipeptide/oligopeptide/nickel transport system permease subunit